MCLRIKLIEAFKNDNLTLELYDQILDDTVKLLPDSKYTAYGDLYEHCMLAQSALKTGAISRRPSLFHPIAQFIWGATLATIAANPEIMNQWPDENKPTAGLINSRLWEQLKDTDKAKEEMIGYCLMLLMYFKAGRDIKIRWGGADYPGNGYYCDMDQSLMNVDLLWTLINGFEHSRCVVYHEIGHAYGSFGLTPKMDELIKQIQELESRPSLRKEEGKLLTEKKVESYLRFLFFQACEDSFANGFPKKIAENKLHFQDFAHSLNVIETLTNVGALILRKNFQFETQLEQTSRNSIPTAYGQVIKTCELMRYAFFINNEIDSNAQAFLNMIGFPIQWLSGKDEKGHHQNPNDIVISFLKASKSLENMNIPLDNAFLTGFKEPKDYLQNQQILKKIWYERARLSDFMFDRYASHLLPEINLEANKKLEEQSNQFAQIARKSLPQDAENWPSQNDTTDNIQESENQSSQKQNDKLHSQHNDSSQNQSAQDSKESMGSESDDLEGDKRGTSTKNTQNLNGGEIDESQKADSSFHKVTQEVAMTSLESVKNGQPTLDLDRDVSKDCQKELQNIENPSQKIQEDTIDCEESKLFQTFRPNKFNRLDVHKKQVHDLDNGKSIVDLYKAPSNVKHMVSLNKSSGMIESQPYDAEQAKRRDQIQHGSFDSKNVNFKVPDFVKDHTVYSAIVAKYPELAMTLKRFFLQMRNSYMEKETIYKKEILPSTDVGQSLDIQSILERKVKIATHQRVDEDDFKHFNNPYTKYHVKHAPIDICVFIDTSGSMHQVNATKFAVEVGSMIYEVTRDNEDYNVYVATMTKPVQFIAMPPLRKIKSSVKNDTRPKIALSNLHETTWVADDKIANGILTTLREIKSRDTVYEKEGFSHFFFITDGYHTDAAISIPMVKKMLSLPSCVTFNWLLVGFNKELKSQQPNYDFLYHPVLTLYESVKTHIGTQTIRVEGVAHTQELVSAFTRLFHERVRELKNYKAIDALKKKKLLSHILTQTKVNAREM